MQVNITTQVNSGTIRREQHNGREHWVVPSYTLPANVVMNGGLYPASEIDAHYQKLEGTLAPLGHPEVNGEFVSAFSPEGINVGHVGAFNRNVKKSGNRIYVEKWIDTEVAQRTDGGRRLLERLTALENGEDVPPIHTSVAVFLERMEASEQQREEGGYDWVAKIHDMDHDAILLDEVGAATPEQGVGMMVNADQAIPVQPNAGALAGQSYREKEQQLDRAAQERFAPGAQEYAWVADFTDSQVVIVQNGGEAQIYGYSIEDGKITFSDTGIPVVRKESWVQTVVNSVKGFFNHQARPDQPQEEGDMPLTPEERAELVKEIGANVGETIAEHLKPISEKVDTLEANQKSLSDSLTANQRAEEEAKRETVAAKFGKDVAEGLTGNALESLYKQCGDAAALAGNTGRTEAETGAPDPVAHFGGAKQ